MIRSSKAIWSGSGKEGKGHLTSTSGVLKDTPYSFMTRFICEDGKAGTNPEELIAAAHAGCFTMKLSFLLGNAGFTPDELDCTSEVKLGPVAGGTGVVGRRWRCAGTVVGTWPGRPRSGVAEAARRLSLGSGPTGR